MAADGRGKANITVTATIVISVNTASYSLVPAKVPGYLAGKTGITLVVTTNTYVSSTATTVPAIDISGFAIGDLLTIVNNGVIEGRGGDGGRGAGGTGVLATTGTNGGTAISLSMAISLRNNGTIGGGGGGGGGGGNAFTLFFIGAGGGGGGQSNGSAGAGGTGATYNGQPGQPGTLFVAGQGGGGGFGGPGGTGGSGGNGGALGTAGSPGVTANGNAPAGTGGLAGKAITLNGYSVTYLITGTISGQVV
jgi:hypothetical protein